MKEETYCHAATVVWMAAHQPKGLQCLAVSALFDYQKRLN